MERSEQAARIQIPQRRYIPCTHSVERYKLTTSTSCVHDSLHLGVRRLFRALLDRHSLKHPTNLFVRKVPLCPGPYVFEEVLPARVDFGLHFVHELCYYRVLRRGPAHTTPSIIP